MAPKEGATTEPPGPAQGDAVASTGKKGKFRKEKPWDVDGIDHWCALLATAPSAAPGG